MSSHAAPPGPMGGPASVSPDPEICGGPPSLQDSRMGGLWSSAIQCPGSSRILPWWPQGLCAWPVEKC